MHTLAMDKSSATKPKRKTEPQASVVRALEALEKVAELGPISLSNLCELMNVPVASLHRSLLSLAQFDLCRCDPISQQWTVGALPLRLSNSFDQKHQLIHRARPTLKALATDANCTAVLAMKNGGSAITVDQAHPELGLQIGLGLGQPLPKASSFTKALYAPEMSKKQKTHPRKNENDFQFRHLVFEDDGAAWAEVKTISACVLDHRRERIGAIGVVAVKGGLISKDHAKIPSLLLQAAATVRMALYSL